MAHMVGTSDRSNLAQKMADVMMGASDALRQVAERPDEFDPEFGRAISILYALSSWAIGIDEEIKRVEGDDCLPTFELIESMRKNGEALRRFAAGNC